MLKRLGWVLVGFCSAAASVAQDGGSGPAKERVEGWEQWRGPTRDGHLAGDDWPEAISGGRLTERWRVEDLGPGYPGPVVADGRVFTVETVDRKQEVVRAFDCDSGKELWHTGWTGAMDVPFFAARNGSWVRSTPAIAGDALFVAGMRDVLVCLDVATGEVRWRVDFVERFGAPLPAFGCVCSPLVAGDHVYVQAGASLVKLDRRTGETVWRSLVDEGGMNGSAFSSPVLTALAGQPQVVVQSRTHLAAVEPEHGQPLWQVAVPAFRGMNILTPLVWDNAVFMASYGGRAMLLGVARGEDGAIATTERWDNNIQGYMTSPVRVGQYVYLFNRSNRFCCIDLASGATQWISGPTGDEYWSLIAQGDRILALNDSGILRLIRANPAAYELIDEQRVSDEETWAHLAIVGQRLYIRELEGLAAFDWQ